MAPIEILLAKNESTYPVGRMEEEATNLLIAKRRPALHKSGGEKKRTRPCTVPRFLMISRWKFRILNPSYRKLNKSQHLICGSYPQISYFRLNRK